MTNILLSLALFLSLGTALQTSPSTPASASTTSVSPVLLTPDQVSKLLPASVFFRGQTAPLQLRNAAAARFADNAVIFASLVDTSGYSSSVRERYQFYLVTETPLAIDGKILVAGAYGAGFLEDGTFVIMDIGGHDVVLSRTTHDENMHRPRPLQLQIDTAAGELRLYLGRSFVILTPVKR